jgi:hypothetical protein
MTKIYLVGDDNAPKTNSWLAMTNSAEEAARLLEELEGASRMKTIEVKADEGS